LLYLSVSYDFKYFSYVMCGADHSMLTPPVTCFLTPNDRSEILIEITVDKTDKTEN